MSTDVPRWKGKSLEREGSPGPTRAPRAIADRQRLTRYLFSLKTFHQRETNEDRGSLKGVHLRHTTQWARWTPRLSAIITTRLRQRDVVSSCVKLTVFN